MCAQRATKTKTLHKYDSKEREDTPKLSAQKASTEGTSSGAESVIIDDNDHGNDDPSSNTANSQTGRKFNLRDRQKICYNKKYGNFILDKGDGDLEGTEVDGNADEDGEQSIDDKQVNSQVTSMTATRKSSRAKKTRGIEEVSDEEFDLK